jgi:hypothetical protein
MYRERLGNGGSHRLTRHINRRPAVNIHHATRMSLRIGLPLNKMVTINLGLAGCEPDKAGHAFRKLLTHRFAPWLRRTAAKVESVPPTYVWTMEAAGSQLAVHWLVHVPVGLQRVFRHKITDWLQSLVGAAPPASAVDVRAIHNLIGARRYILKGIDPAWAAHLAVRPVDQGSVVGKRSGFSKNLGPAARRRDGYRPRRAPFKAGK